MTHDFKTFPELTNSQMDLYYLESPHKQIVEDFFARVTKVHDGDTITLSWDERNFDFPVRFANIAAPELAGPGGKESQQWLEHKVLGQEVYIQIDKKNRVDKWGRLLGRISLGGIDLGDESVNNGQSKPWNERSDGIVADTVPNLDAEVAKWTA